MKSSLTLFDITLRAMAAFICSALILLGVVDFYQHMTASVFALNLVTIVLGLLALMAVNVYSVLWARSAFASVKPDVPPSPWDQQRMLMVASGQQVPKEPTLTKGSLLYAALIMEETGETLMALVDTLSDYFDFVDVIGLPESEHPNSMLDDLKEIRHGYYMLGTKLIIDSEGMRKQVAKIEDGLELPMGSKWAVELLDGTTDIAVVNCGFALSCGLPGEAGYDEIVDSNLSKRNPDTMMIDKTADGKWIKGPKYFKPDLASVIKRNRAK